MNEVDYWDSSLKGLALPRGQLVGINPSMSYGFVGEPDTVPQRKKGNGKPWDIGEIIDSASKVVCIIDPKRCQQRQSEDNGTVVIPEAETNTGTSSTGKKGIPEWVWYVGIGLLIAIILILILKK
jgi:hypothetical protein